MCDGQEAAKRRLISAARFAVDAGAGDKLETWMVEKAEFYHYGGVAFDARGVMWESGKIGAYVVKAVCATTGDLLGAIAVEHDGLAYECEHRAGVWEATGEIY